VLVLWEGIEMKSVEDLDVFKLAHQLALKTYSTTKVFPREETFSLVDQMRRAATSVGMNLMEGAMRLVAGSIGSSLASREVRPAKFVINYFSPEI
jgi:23S rRNA-intervening sequence protein